MSITDVQVAAIFDAVLSHPMALGKFERVNGHEPKNAPGLGLTAAVWLDGIRPVPAGSGLAETTGVLVFNVRIYGSMTVEPQDGIDPNIAAAAIALFAAYSGDFDLGGTVRNIDLLGQAGPPLAGQAGYLNQDGKLYRVFTLVLPVIVNDMWDQVA
jgi:hypothetical protein